MMISKSKTRVRSGVSRTGHIGTTRAAERQKPLPVARLSSSPTFTPFHLTLTGQLPSGKNAMQVTRTGRHYPKLRFQLWRDEAVYALMQQWKRRKMMSTPNHLTCDYWPGDLRTRDVPGMLDALFHALVKAEIIQDDGLIHNVTWRRHELNRKAPKVILTLEEAPLS